MGMTLTQKILAAHAGLAEVKAGQLINAKLDIVLGNDITTPVAINEFERAGQVFRSGNTRLHAGRFEASLFQSNPRDQPVFTGGER